MFNIFIMQQCFNVADSCRRGCLLNLWIRKVQNKQNKYVFRYFILKYFLFSFSICVSAGVKDCQPTPGILHFAILLYKQRYKTYFQRQWKSIRLGCSFTVGSVWLPTIMLEGSVGTTWFCFQMPDAVQKISLQESSFCMAISKYYWGLCSCTLSYNTNTWYLTTLT